MNNRLILEPYKIKGESTDWEDDFAESIFFIGNGRMGVRGYLPFDPSKRGASKGLYMAGIFGEIKPGITDLVNLPTPVFDTLKINDKEAVLASVIEREYSLSEGIVKFEFDLRSDSDPVHISHERFFDITNPGIFAQRTVITSLSQSETKLSLTGGISPYSCNSPIPDDQVKHNDEQILLANLRSCKLSESGINAEYLIKGTDLTVEEKVSFCIDKPHTSKEAGETLLTFFFDLSAGESISIDKITTLLSSRDADDRIRPYDEKRGYTELKKAHTAAFSERMARCFANKSPEDTELRAGLNYSMMQLIMNCSSNDPTVNIGARGISHGRYKGCYFWDTDIFMLPFFIKNDLTAAKNLCMYRINMLPAAKKHSQNMNTKGARYPWMSSLDGSEQCETWDIGCSEVHVTADVVYAIDKYIKASGDEELYLDKTAEVYVETSRFWASRYTWNKEKTRANLLFCKGPDEYCGITTNNLFTNVMVKNNLDLGIMAAKDLKNSRPEIYSRLNITDTEISEWEKLKDCIPIPKDPETGRLSQDETFYMLEPVDIGLLKSGNDASYHNVCFDRLQRYRVVKQADLLLIMTRFPDIFTPEEKLDAWKDYEPLCLHDSTLSFASHALFAFQNGLKDEGMEYLKKALLLDLRDIMNNTGNEGLHLANMGEVWSAVQALD